MRFISKIWAFLKTPSSKPFGLIVFLSMIVGVIGWLGFNAGINATATHEFCTTSCHEMSWVTDEYEQTIHYKNRSGVRATCADCHVPKGTDIKDWFDKMLAKTKAAAELYHYAMGTIDTKEKFEAYRWTMANSVWDSMRARGSKECLNCHNFDHMNPEDQGRMARKRHAKAKQQGKTCIDCHTGIAHEEPEEPDEPEEEENS
ncbi:MAG: NapC/NirT family cytochrome c [Magnetococcales bacterium]|nr:NapC/NirT family cytochrome c [Magnetococcales bacterium]